MNVSNFDLNGLSARSLHTLREEHQLTEHQRNANSETSTKRTSERISETYQTLAASMIRPTQRLDPLAVAICKESQL